jgi:Tat protein translocase TatC
MSGPGAEMPFLDHLEELRSRLIRALAAIVVGFGVGLWVVQRFQLIKVLKEPIAPYLASTGGKLAVLSPTDPVLIVLKLGFITGLVLASPVVIYQIWAFLAPALYTRERKAVVPALGFGLLLFLTGSALGYFYLLPQALRVLFSFQSDALALVITYTEYFSFVSQVVLAMGLSFELPLVIIILAALGVISPMGLHRFRRFAVVLCMAAGAILSPGTDVVSMIMMTIPLLLLYEVGFIGAWVIERRRRRAAATAVLVLLGILATPGAARAQVPVKPLPPKPSQQVPAAPAAPADTTAKDSTKVRPGQAIDTATARRLGLPTGPAYSFAPEDSTLTALLALDGYEGTRFRGDSATLYADERRIFLQGHAMTKRNTTTLEADSITYQETTCRIEADGSPNLFDGETVLTGGGGIRYDTCIRRGVVTRALTSFKQNSTDWFLRGNLAQDSSASRVFASSSEITSCDLPEPHYHFSAKEVKWISQTIMIARPAVLYVRDVPILWLPFIFADGRTGRRSGILIPRFGINDIVRPNPSYNRQVTNIGYYWAPNDYIDLTGRLDWYANRYVQYGVSGQYRWLNRFLSGSFGYNTQRENTGSYSTNIRWDHRQNFDLSTSLNLSLNYASNSQVVSNNAIDPLLSTQQILSSANFAKRFAWGTVNVGANRRQPLSPGQATTMQLPAFAITPKPIDITRDITWSPSYSLTNDLTNNSPISPSPVRIQPGGVIDTLSQTFDQRATAMSLDTPVRFWGFDWRNSFSYSDQQKNGRTTAAQIKVPNPATPDPTDSIVVAQAFTGDFSTAFDWQTGVNLPTAFRSTWKLQPVIGVANASSAGPFAIRNRNTNGDWVFQGKRLNLGVTASPTFFGFFPGFGPIGRIRHSFSPTISYTYNPASNVSTDYAFALQGPGVPLVTHTDPTQTLSVGLSQNVEGKAKVAPGDTTSGENVKKYRLLGLTTSAVQYDFEQAKLPGRTGWKTDQVTNTFQSDLLPGFNLSLTHELWDGPAGFSSSHFDLFLQDVTASAAVSSGTVTSILRAFGLAKKPAATAKQQEQPPPSYVASQSRYGRPPSFYTSDNSGYGFQSTSSRRFSANFNYTLVRSRPSSTTPAQPTQQNLGFSTTFAPTPFWTASWSSQYNITDGKFEATTVRLERTLHEWRAGFNFIRNANGNFAFYFSIYLNDLPEIKADYNQTTIER